MSPVASPVLYKRRRKMAACDVPDALWPTDNDWGVPVIKQSFCANAVDLPVSPWAAEKRKTDMRGTWLLQGVDVDSLWRDPTRVINSGCVALVESDVSDAKGYAVKVYEAYRRRWLSRFWQEFGGIRIYINLNVVNDTTMLGVPKGWKAYAVSGALGIGAVMGARRVAQLHSDLYDPLLLVYGGGESIEMYCRTIEAVWVK